MLSINPISSSKQHKASQDSFTLIETLMIIVIIGIIAVIAVPRFINMRAEAIAGVEEGVAGAVRSGIKIYGATSAIHDRQPMYPDNLDNATIAKASTKNIFFDSVLAQPVSDSWSKILPSVYQGPTKTFYIYDPDNGTFGTYVSDMTIADNNPHNFLPALTAEPLDPSIWANNGTSPYSPWANNPVNFDIDFQNPGNYTFSLNAINNANHPAFLDGGTTTPRTGWTLPAGYTQFVVWVTIDNGDPFTVNIPASDTTAGIGNVKIPINTAGNHTVSVIWKNDEWDPNLNYDANIQLNDLTVTAAS